MLYTGKSREVILPAKTQRTQRKNNAGFLTANCSLNFTQIARIFFLTDDRELILSGKAHKDFLTKP